MTPRRTRDAGLTLVEVLVVLAIVGVASGAAVLGLASIDRGARAEAEARRLADRLSFAADEALVTGAPRALVWDATGYRFIAWDPAASGWRDQMTGPLAPPRQFSGGLTLATVDVDPQTLVIAPDRAPPAAALRLRSAGEDWWIAFDGLAAEAAPIKQ